MRNILLLFICLFVFNKAVAQNVQPFVRDRARQANTLADAKALSLIDNDLVFTKGYTTAGDGGGQELVYHATGWSAGGYSEGPFYHRIGVTDAYLEALDKTVADVRWAGAVGDGATDDTVAIQAAANACAEIATAIAADGNIVYNKPKLYFPPTINGGGYRTTSTVNINEGIDVVMEDRIVFDNVSASPALIIGRNGITQKNFNANITVEVVRSSTAASVDLTNDVGVRFINPYYCNIHIRGVFKWSIGAQLLGTNGSSALYNQVTLGAMRSCNIALDLRGDGGACNENVFYGGRFNAGIANGSNESYGVRLSNSSTSVAFSDNNYFIKPSFELNPELGVSSYCFLVTDATGLVVENMRSESNGAGTQYYARFTGASENNKIFISAGGDNTAAYEDSSEDRTNYIFQNKQIWNTLPASTIFHVDNLGKKSNFYDGSTNIFVPGMCFYTAADTSLRKIYASGGAASISTSGVTTANVGVGRVVDTSSVKRFIVNYTADDPAAIWVKCFDTNGNFMSPSGQTYASFPGVFVTSNTYSNSGTNVASMPITFEDSVKSAVIGVTNMSNLSSFTIRAWDAQNIAVSTEPGYETPIDNQSIATAIPTAGTYSSGHVIYKDETVEGDIQGWQCVESGTPGTWVELSRIGTQLDYFIGGTSEKQLGNSGSPHLGATTDWEIEARVYRTGSGSVQTIYAQNDGTTGDIQLNVNASNFIQLFFGGVQQIDGSIQVPANIWTTVKATRTGNTYELFVNDVSAATHTEAGSVDQTYNTIGGNGEGGNLFQGYIDWVKVTNNSIEVYNTDFKSPLPSNNYTTLTKALESSSLIDTETITTQGYYSPGDGGGQDLIYHSTGWAAGGFSEGPFYHRVGATDAYLEAKDKSVANVKWAGAVGDKTTDDTAAVQAAIDAAGDQGFCVVEFPSGKYTVDSLTIPGAVHLRGEGGEESFIYASDASSGVFIQDEGNAVRINIEKLAIYGNSTSYSAEGNPNVTHVVQLGQTIQWGTGSFMRDVNIRNFPNAIALDIDQNISMINHVWVAGCKQGLVIQGNGLNLSHVQVTGTQATTPVDITGGCQVYDVEIEAVGPTTAAARFRSDGSSSPPKVWGLYISMPGQTQTATASAATNTLTVSSGTTIWNDDNMVTFTTAVAGLSTGTPYYVMNRTSTTFQVTLDPPTGAQTAANITADGSTSSVCYYPNLVQWDKAVGSLEGIQLTEGVSTYGQFMTGARELSTPQNVTFDAAKSIGEVNTTKAVVGRIKTEDIIVEEHSLYFDGSDDKVTLTDVSGSTALPPFASSSDVTTTISIKFQSDTIGTVPLGSTTYTQQYGLYVGSATQLYHKVPTGITSYLRLDNLNSVTARPTHIIIRRNGTGNDFNAWQDRASITPVYLGTMPDIPPYYNLLGSMGFDTLIWSGQIYHYRIWERALTDAEVTAEFSGNTPDGAITDLSFHEGTGDRTYDLASSSYGLFSGNPAWIEHSRNLWADHRVNDQQSVNSGSTVAFTFDNYSAGKMTITGNNTDFQFAFATNPGIYTGIVEIDGTGGYTGCDWVFSGTVNGLIPTVVTNANTINYCTVYYDGTDWNVLNGGQVGSNTQTIGKSGSSLALNGASNISALSGSTQVSLVSGTSNFSVSPSLIGAQGGTIQLESGGGAMIQVVNDDVGFYTPNTGALVLPSDADPQTNVTTPINGAIKYDSTTHELLVYINGAWYSINVTAK